MVRAIADNRGRRAAALLGIAALAGALYASGAETPRAAAANVDWTAAKPVKVELADERFVPDKLTFQRGVAYHLHLENTGKEMHEFTAQAFFTAVSLKNPEALDLPGREVVLQPGQTRDVYFIAQKAGRYELTCADHDWAGMVGNIAIEQ